MHLIDLYKNWPVKVILKDTEVIDFIWNQELY